MFFSLSALFLKKFRKIASEKLHPCPHVLDIRIDYFRFQTYCLNFILDGLNFMRMKSDGILKGTWASCTKYRKYKKICFKMNEILDFNLHCKFRSRWTYFGNIIRKKENQFPSPVLLIKFMLSLQNQQYFNCNIKTFCLETLKILWNMKHETYILLNKLYNVVNIYTKSV